MRVLFFYIEKEECRRFNIPQSLSLKIPTEPFTESKFPKRSLWNPQPYLIILPESLPL